MPDDAPHAPPRTPTRFRDPREPKPWAARIRSVPGVRARADDPRLARLRDALSEGDPLADALVEWMHGRPRAEGRALLDRALDDGIASVPDAPAPLVALFAQVDREPAWLDRRALRLGCETLLRVGRGGYWSLAALSLMSGYLSSGAVKPLAMTGALKGMARRRVAETSKLVWDLATSGDVPRRSDGFKTAVRVRVMHALVRRGLARSPAWRAGDWGAPINQHDLLGTHLEFSVVAISGLYALGFWLSRAEREAVMHLWRYASWLVGAREDLLPATFAEGLEWLALFAMTEQGPDDDSRALAAALLAVPRQGQTGALGRALGAAESRFIAGLARLLLGDAAGDALGLPRGAWTYAPLVVAPVITSLEALRVVVPGGRALAIRAGRAMTRAQIAGMLEGHAPTFEPRTAAASTG